MLGIALWKDRRQKYIDACSSPIMSMLIKATQILKREIGWLFSGKLKFPQSCNGETFIKVTENSYFTQLLNKNLSKCEQTVSNFEKPIPEKTCSHKYHLSVLKSNEFKCLTSHLVV